MNNLNLHRLIPIGICVIMVFALAYPYIEERRLTQEESVKLEHLSCISAICSEDKTFGEFCREVPPQIGVTKLISQEEGSRVVVELTGKGC